MQQSGTRNRLPKSLVPNHQPAAGGPAASSGTPEISDQSLHNEDRDLSVAREVQILASEKSRKHAGADQAAGQTPATSGLIFM